MASNDTKESSQRFASLLAEELISRKKKNDAFEILDEHKETIGEARRLKVSHTKIAKFLQDSGVKANTELVRQFCQKALGETPKKRKRAPKSKTKKSVVTPEKKDMKTTNNKGKANFRVAGDDL